MKLLLTITTAIVVSLCPTSLYADPMPYTTSAGSVSWLGQRGSVGPQVSDLHINGPSTVSTQGALQYDGYGLAYDGYASAARGSLHASASYDLFGACGSCTGDAWGDSADAFWTEPSVRAVLVGPGDLMSGIVAYEFKWNLDGTFQGPINGPVALLQDTVWQNGVATQALATYYAPPLGPITFYVQPSDPSSPFDLGWGFYAETYSTDPSVPHESVDFSDTATLASVVAVDANGNVIPGVELELSDGTLLGPNGFSSPTGIPEPSSISLLAAGMFALGVGVLRKIRLAQ